MSQIEVYGFGSFFCGNPDYRDIDLLLIHENRSKESCFLAINCKRQLQAIIRNLHVTMLSKQAEHSFAFKFTARAKYLGCIDMSAAGRDIEEILKLIQAYSPFPISIENENQIH